MVESCASVDCLSCRSLARYDLPHSNAPTSTSVSRTRGWKTAHGARTVCQRQELRGPIIQTSQSEPCTREASNHGQGWSTAHQMWILRVRQAAQSGSRARCETCGDERGGRATCRSCVRAPRWRRWSTKPVILQRHPTSARASREIYVHRANSIFMLQVQRSERSTLARSRCAPQRLLPLPRDLRMLSICRRAVQPRIANTEALLHRLELRLYRGVLELGGSAREGGARGGDVHHLGRQLGLLQLRLRAREPAQQRQGQHQSAYRGETPTRHRNGTRTRCATWMTPVSGRISSTA
jgi:hypothetical protein